MKAELREEVVATMNEIEVRFKRVENYKGTSAAKNDKTYERNDSGRWSRNSTAHTLKTNFRVLMN